MAIGGTTADAKLQIDYGANPDDTSVDVLRLGSTVGSGYDEEFRIKWYSGTGDLAYIGSSYTDATAGNDKAYLAFGTRTSDVVSERLRIDHDGTQDHKANSIVNSATVAGLQDGGACYDFDGSGDVIDVGAGVLAHENITISLWVKPADKDSPSLQGLVSNGSTNSDRRDLIINSNRFEFNQDSYSSANQVVSSTAECREGVWPRLSLLYRLWSYCLRKLRLHTLLYQYQNH